MDNERNNPNSDNKQFRPIERINSTRVTIASDDLSKGGSSGDAATATTIRSNHEQPKQQQQQPQKKTHLKPITHRSQSSPSSLTTHKFGLKPTPSPPRLIIDHQTGDIIESYPEQPVYLRTYQPLDDNHETDNTNEEDDDDDDYSTSNAFDLDSSQLTHSYPAAQLIKPAAAAAAAATTAQKRTPLSSKGLTNARLQDPSQQQQQQQQSYLSSGDEDLSGASSQPAAYPISASSMRGSTSRGGFIPPPHAAGKVYFAPPNPSAGHLFHQDDYEDVNAGGGGGGGGASIRIESDRLQMQQQQRAADEAAAIASEHSSLQSTFKRAINKLNESSPRATTDIALVTHPDLESSKQNEIKIMATPKFATPATKLATSNNHGANQLQQQAAGQPTVKGGGAGSGKVRYLSTTEADNKRADQRYLDQDPAIESFRELYSVCFNFRIILAFLLSGLIIYLLVVPLNFDCTKYRPTFSYISIILASVNLICLTIFTLFWYCSGVTRTLYSNISSSAFIITIYSILVAINLALAIIFFLVGTCHFQRLINTQQHRPAPASMAQGFNGAAAAAVAAALQRNQLTDELETTTTVLNLNNADDQSSLFGGGGGGDDGDEQPMRRSLSRRGLAHQPELQQVPNSGRFVRLAANGFEQSAANGGGAGADADADSAERAGLMLANETGAIGGLGGGGGGYTMSPIEAAWEYTIELLEQLARRSHKLLLQYDLRIVGAMHALCAICFQYLAMKVAVVRSYFNAPVGEEFV